MPIAFSMPEFWFGLAVLCAFQGAKFWEVGSSDSWVREAYAAIPNLRAPDFVGRLAFWLALLVFLLLTFLTYLVLCSLSPALLTGWAKVTGVTEDTTEFIASVPYPLYIAAALVGLAQFILPISNFGSIQRNAIHSLIGVPKKLVQFARYLFDKLIVSEDKSALSDFVIRLTSTQWQTNLSAFADSGFYASHLRRLELDDDTERKDILSGSMRELRSLVNQLLLLAVIATVRKSGAKGLARLAATLGVPMPPRMSTPLPKDYISSGVFAIVVVTILWIAIPMLYPIAKIYLIGLPDFWPKTLAISGQYLLSNVVPIFASAVLTLTMWSRHRNAASAADKTGILTQFDKHATIILTVILVVILYDLAQALYDFGYFEPIRKDGAFEFLATNLPFYLVHSFISIATCFIVLYYVQRRIGGFKSSMLILFSVGLIAVFYAESRLYFQYDGADGHDFIALLVGVNEIAALLALGSAALVTRRLILPPSMGSNTATPALSGA